MLALGSVHVRLAHRTVHTVHTSEKMRREVFPRVLWDRSVLTSLLLATAQPQPLRKHDM